MSSVSLQIFVYRHKLIVSHENNFPLVRFQTKDEMHEFIKGLVSISPEDRDDETGTYFVINNPQLLPSDVRDLHTCTLNIVEADDEGNIQTRTQKRDGIFLLSDNLEQIRALPKEDIDNNTNSEIGFYEVIYGIND